MARTSIKSTYALDVETIRALERIADGWGVSKSEALRRAIHAAARERSTPGADAIKALDDLQNMVGLSRSRMQDWAQASRAERRRSSSRGGT